MKIFETKNNLIFAEKVFFIVSLFLFIFLK